MVYVYDTELDINTVSLKRFGVTYRLEKHFKMGSREMASFIAPGEEKLLIIPRFIQQYRQVEKKIQRISGKNYRDFAAYVERYIDPEHHDDELPTDESSTGWEKTMVCRYKDIRITLEYLNDAGRISKEFEIVENNLFGNGIVVDLGNKEEE